MFQKTDRGKQSLQGAILEVEFPALVKLSQVMPGGTEMDHPCQDLYKVQIWSKVNNYYFKPLNVGLVYYIAIDACIFGIIYLLQSKRENFL